MASSKKSQQEKDEIQKKDDVIQKNAVDLIYHAGLLKKEIMQLTVGDVLQNSRIVPKISPVAGPYPRDYKKIGTKLSHKSIAILAKHIKYLQSNALVASSNDPLFYNVSTSARYTDATLIRVFSLKTVYCTYREHRESGIRKFAWDLSSKGYDEQRILNKTHRFARYTNMKTTERVMREALKQDPQKYDALYKQTRDFADRLISSLNSEYEWKIKSALEELEENLDHLFPRHTSPVVKAINEALDKAEAGCVIYGEETLSIEDISIRILKKEAKKRRARSRVKLKRRMCKPRG